jgi:hypothetical protein
LLLHKNSVQLAPVATDQVKIPDPRCIDSEGFLSIGGMLSVSKSEVEMALHSLREKKHEVEYRILANSANNKNYGAGAVCLDQETVARSVQRKKKQEAQSTVACVMSIGLDVTSNEYDILDIHKYSDVSRF